jgi:hypothetical protein
MGNGAESIGAIADTIAEARADAERKLPHLAMVASERVVSYQETKIFTVSAPEYETAQERGKELMGEPSSAAIRLNSFDSCKTDMPLLDARSVRLLGPGEDGLLKYEVKIVRRVAVELFYDRKPS